MKSPLAQSSFPLGKFIARACGPRFIRRRDYRGGTDADHLPMIPGNDFSLLAAAERYQPANALLLLVGKGFRFEVGMI